MAENLFAIHDVKEGMVNWTVKAMVIEKGYPRITSTSQTYQKIVLIDSKVSVIYPMLLSNKGAINFPI